MLRRYVPARQADDHLEAEHRAALAGAVEALAAVSPDRARAEPKLIHILERASDSACCCVSRAAARCRATCLRAPVHPKTLTACSSKRLRERSA
jgi:hypothetical protein